MRLRCIFIILHFGFLASYAQSPALRVKYFTKEDGIFNSYVNHVAQDSTGFLWVATREGLYKYDGYGFKGYFSRKGDSTSLTNSNINWIYTDSKGKLWIGTTQGICFYNEPYDNFIRVADQKKNAGLSALNIGQILEDSKGILYVNNSSEIYRYDEGSNHFNKVYSVEGEQINSFAIDEDNYLWLGYNNNLGIIKVNPATGVSVQFKISDTTINNLSISRLIFENNALWIASLGQGIFRLDIKSGILIHFPSVNSDEAMAVNINIDNKGNVWSTDYTGLKFVHKESLQLEGYYPKADDPFTVKKSIKGIFQDKQGNYWLYHEPGGLGISMQLKGFAGFGSNIQEIWHTSGSNVISLQEDRKGNLWIGYFDGGIDIFSWQQGKIIHFVHNEKDKYSLGRGSILCIFRDSEGVMWVGTYFSGLQYYEESSGKFITYAHDPENNNSIAGNDIRSIAEDKEGNLWLAVHFKGVDKFNKKSKTAIHYNHELNKLSNNWPFQVIIDHRDDLWVATAWGLNRLKKGSSTFEPFVSNPNDTSGLIDNSITCLYEDNNHILWIGTSAGLNSYDPVKNKFSHYENKFESNYITGIAGDKNNNIWVSTFSGLSMIDMRNKSIHNFNTSDGLLSGEYNARSVYCNERNELFFGGSKGFDVFNPDKLIFNNTAPVVIIDKIMILNKEQTVSNSAKLRRHISHTSAIVLKYSDKVISLRFKALNFINPESNKYAYKLEGFDKKWNYVGGINDATYTNLDPGKYEFKVIASNNDGIWNKTGASLTIIVSPPWYGTAAFRIFAILFTIALIFGFINLRTSKLNRQRILLEKTVRDKTHELSTKNLLLKTHTENLNEANKLLLERQNQLQSQSEELKKQSVSLVEVNTELQKYNATKDKLFSIIAHDLISPFNTIIGFSELLKTRFNSLEEEEIQQYISIINSSSEKVFSLLNSLLLWSRSQTNRISYQPENIALNIVIKEVLELSAENLKAKQISTHIDCPVNAMAWADLEMLKIIIRNLLSNAMKFTPKNGSIHFKVKKDTNMVSISVMDTGTGIDREKIDELLSAVIVNPEQGTEGESGSGLGITLCKDFIKKNKGQFFITSEAGKGSIFTFTLPVAANDDKSGTSDQIQSVKPG
jgi:signal transduction histidine kinase/ligand-binding sensor domain-containing protein